MVLPMHMPNLFNLGWYFLSARGFEDSDGAIAKFKLAQKSRKCAKSARQVQFELHESLHERLSSASPLSCVGGCVRHRLPPFSLHQQLLRSRGVVWSSATNCNHAHQLGCSCDRGPHCGKPLSPSGVEVGSAELHSVASQSGKGGPILAIGDALSHAPPLCDALHITRRRRAHRRMAAARGHWRWPAPVFEAQLTRHSPMQPRLAHAVPPAFRTGFSAARGCCRSGMERWPVS